MTFLCSKLNDINIGASDEVISVLSRHKALLV